MKTLKKLTIKDILGQKPAVGDTIAISGVVDAYTVKPTQYGDAIKFQGDFVACNKKTGGLFTSSSAYFPNDLTESLVARLDKGDITVDFACEVMVAESLKSNTGYTFIVSALQTEEIIERKQQLIKKMNQFLSLPSV